MRRLPFKRVLGLLLLATGATHACADNDSWSFNKAIYGEDDRRETEDPANDPRLRKAASAVAIVVPRARLTSPGDIIQTQTYRQMPRLTLGEKYNLCSGEPFAKQPAPGYCSGFLVGSDLIVTAGHCVRSAADCSHAAFVFDYKATQSDHEPRIVPTRNVFYCQRIEAQKVDHANGIDFAVVRLDRSAGGRTPLYLHRWGRLDDNASLAVIGHPSGLPQKIAASAKVRNNEQSGYFVIDADTFGGSSGSPVLNTRTLEVEGIAVRGEEDFDQTQAGCQVAKRCKQDECRGEDATRIDAVLDHIPEAGATMVMTGARVTGEVTGNGNKLPEPGEEVDLALAVLNNGPLELTDARMNLRSLTSGVEVTQPQATLASLKPGQVGEADGFAIKIAPSVACTTPVKLELVAAFDGTSRLSRAVLELGESKPVLHEKKGTWPIPDANTDGVTITLPNVEGPAGREVQVGLTLEHANTDHLRVTLQPPEGDEIVLHYFGYSPDGSLIEGPRDGIDGVYGLDFSPFGNLAPLRKISSRGTWKLRVADHRPGLKGKVTAFSVVVMDRACR